MTAALSIAKDKILKTLLVLGESNDENDSTPLIALVLDPLTPGGLVWPHPMEDIWERMFRA